MVYRKRATKKRSTRKRRTRIYRSLKAVVPDKHVVKMRYVHQFNLDPPTGVNGVQVFRANSIFDPDYSGIGHQPLGHDQWAVFYDHYNVLSSKINCKFVSTGSLPLTDACLVGILLKDNVTVITNPEAIMEQTNSGYKVLSTQLNTSVSKSFNPKRFFGVKDVNDNRGLIGASMGQNPAEDALFHVYQSPLSTSDDPRPIRCIATIEYIVQFTERKSLAQS